MDAASAAMTTFGAALLLVSWVLMLITAWREDYAWGLFATLLPPLAYLYGLFRLDKAGQSVGIAVLGLLLLGLGLG
ncbi:MAG TPA: hypothetical protein DD491_08535 [Halieaceae bacterium]|nr:hypothetical protein [Halieaceae bacterium]